jgi:undecaprenyl-diphosphatase
MSAIALRSRATLVFLLCVVAPLVLFSLIAIRITESVVPDWDRSLVLRSATWNRGRLGLDAHKVADYTTPLGVLLVSIVLVALLLKRRWRDALFWALAVGGSVVLGVFLKEVFRRPPPPVVPHGYSFPSGASFTAVTTYLALLLVLRQSRVRTLAVVVGGVVVLITGTARIFIEWHYLSDVLAGWLLGVSWVTALWLVTTSGRSCDPSGGRSYGRSHDNYPARAP